MEINDLKAAWAHLESRTDAIEAREEATRQQGVVQRARARLGILGAGLVLQAVVGAVLTLLGGSYWFDHWGQLHLVLAGMALHLFGLLLVGSAIVQTMAWRSIDFAGPVFEVQARVARLRVSRARSERLILIAGMVLWAPAGLMLVESLGLDLWSVAPAFVLANVAVGVAIAAALAWAMRRWPEAFDRLVIGGGLKRAEATLSQLKD